MNKKTLLTLCLAIATVHYLNAQSFEAAATAVKNMKIGWNLGNTLEAHSQKNLDPTKDNFWGQQGLDSENCWGQPNVRPALFKMMKEAGFGAIRVPVTWYNHMDKNGKVNTAWMARVKEVVDAVLAQGLYCIINVHHDTGADESGKYYHWIKASGDNYNSNKERYEYLWKQIAEEFKDYDQFLLFESYNEMLDKYGSWNYASAARSGGYNSTDADDAYDAVNKYAQSFVNVVRATGGKNAQRNLVVNTYGACSGSGTWNSHLQDPLKKMALPTDAASNHLMFQIHAYPGLKNNNLSSIKQEVTTMMGNLKSILAAKGAPVIIGEWGTIDDDSDVNYRDNNANYLSFCKHFVEKAKENDITTFYWMGLSDGSNRSLPVFNQPDLAETIINAYYGSTSGFIFPTRDNLSTVYDITFNSQWTELNLVSSTINTSAYKGLELELEEEPSKNAFQFKVYPSGKTVSISSAKSTLTFSSDMGTSISRITLQSCLASNTTTVESVNLIKTDGTKIKSDISPFWGCVVDERVITGITPVRTTKLRSKYIYDLRGQRMTNPRQGIYIQNGKKYIAK